MRSIVNSNETSHELTRDEASEGTLRSSPRHKKCSKTVAAAVSTIVLPSGPWFRTLSGGIGAYNRAPTSGPSGYSSFLREFRESVHRFHDTPS